MLKTKTEKLRALDFTDKFNMCSYINSMKGDIDIINITHADGLYTIFYLEKTQWIDEQLSLKYSLKQAVLPLLLLCWNVFLLFF